MAKKAFHLKSMTAFGRGVSDFSFGRFTVEIQSVNRRYLELNIGLPKALMRFEMDVRGWITALIGRGSLNVSIYLKDLGTRPYSVKPNLNLAHAIKRSYEKIASELGMESRIDLSLLARESGLLLYEEELTDETTYKEALKKAVSSALEQLVAMKEKEGHILASDLQERIKLLKSKLKEIEKNAPQAVEKYKQKLNERLKEFFEKSSDTEEKILREIAIFSEKVDITEEIVRFQSHLDQFEEVLVKPLAEASETKGKTLDFLLQELNREINTIGSKTGDKNVSQHVIEIKSELERMREQVQNIE